MKALQDKINTGDKKNVPGWQKELGDLTAQEKKADGEIKANLAKLSAEEAKAKKSAEKAGEKEKAAAQAKKDEAKAKVKKAQANKDAA